MVAQAVHTAIVAWQVYELTSSAVSLAFLGVFHFLPGVVASFLGGALADTRDRRAILALASLLPISTSLLLWALTATQTVTVMAIYVCVAAVGLAQAFEGPARQSLLPQIVPRSAFQRAVALSTTISQLARVVGPATGGLIIYQLGVAPAYLYHAAIVMIGVASLFGIRTRAENTVRRALSLDLVKEGLVFIKNHPAVLGAMTLDMVAVIFAGAEVLLPIYAQDILGVGAVGYGLLNSSKAVGAFAIAVVLAFLPPFVNTGRVLVITIVLYGLATLGFGLSTWFPLSLLLFALIGAFDQVSVLMRQSIIQMGTPDELRGRVNSVNFLFVGASNQLGPTRAGLVAAASGSAIFAVVSGGIGCLVGTGLVLLFIPSLWRHRTEREPLVLEPRRADLAPS
jgi:MFS family permease